LSSSLKEWLKEVIQTKENNEIRTLRTARKLEKPDVAMHAFDPKTQGGTCNDTGLLNFPSQENHGCYLLVLVPVT
jgi:hypothetical protein